MPLLRGASRQCGTTAAQGNALRVYDSRLQNDRPYRSFAGHHPLVRIAGEELLTSVKANTAQMDELEDIAGIVHDRDLLMSALTTAHDSRLAKIGRMV